MMRFGVIGYDVSIEDESFFGSKLDNLKV